MKKIVLAAIVTGLFQVATVAMAQDRSQTTTDRQSTETTDAYGNTRESESTRQTSITQEEERSRISKGGLFIEPMIFGSQEDTSIESSQISGLLSDTSGTSRGYGVGLRFGGHVSEVFLIGIDGRYSKNQMEDSFYQSADADVYNIAPMVGLQTPLFGVRLLAGYVLTGENNPAAGVQGLDLKFKEASGWRLGAGLHVGPVSVNVEYQDLRYNTTEVESIGSLALNDDVSVDSRTNGYVLTLGFPVEL